MVLLFAHHLLAGFRTREISVDFSAESVVVRIERISTRYLLRHYAIAAFHRIVHGMRPGLIDHWFRDFSALPELICILRLTFRCHSTLILFSLTMWFNAFG